MGKDAEINRKLRYVSVVVGIIWIILTLYNNAGNLVYAIWPVSVGIIILVALALRIVRDFRPSRT